MLSDLDMLNKWFSAFARKVAYWAGTSKAFITAVLSIIVWAAFGPKYNYSDSWSLVVNTGTTIITYLMVFLIQHSQNKDAIAIQAKLSRCRRVASENASHTDDSLWRLTAQASVPAALAGLWRFVPVMAV
jgi:low affinity Fe/Cu permease